MKGSSSLALVHNPHKKKQIVRFMLLYSFIYPMFFWIGFHFLQEHGLTDLQFSLIQNCYINKRIGSFSIWC
ncbi:hypothetical protein Lalb_Chr15g0080641 [Lupinus albus]|uniref:Uncharacterized protein n=1 Tax=Lupinus albus TaxID=3870 RepID=A0A6A4PD48_LUPAL|nr:hypothetical protein Lalb_Chr15g0080641 [Lupinus albus]